MNNPSEKADRAEQPESLITPQKMQTFARNCYSFPRIHWRGILIIVTPFMFYPITLIGDDKAYMCMYLLAVMVMYWVSEVIPVVVTALLPVLAFPIMGIMSTEEACVLYFRDTFVMFASYLASAVAYSGLHMRLAFRVVTIVGCSPRRLHFGLVFFAMFCSMWLTNSACVILMVSILDVIVAELSEQGICKMYLDDDAKLPKAERRPTRLATCYYLSIAYATSIGGVSILIGSPTNLIVRSVYERYFPMDCSEIQFGRYMLYAMPIALTSVFFLYIDMEIVFMGLFRPNSDDAKEATLDEIRIEHGKKIFVERYKQLGPITTHEMSIVTLILAMVVFFTCLEMYGEGLIMNTVPVVGVVLLLFSLPTNYKFLKFWHVSSLEETPTLLTWPFALGRIPWRLIFLVGGGTTFAEGSKITGMACTVGCSLTILGKISLPLMTLILIASEVLLTNCIANVAVASITLPIVAEIAITLEINPLYLILASGVACSMPFLLPTGTLPNALIHQEANVKTKYMVLGGILPSITTILTIWIYSQTLGFVIYDNMDTYPDWANKSTLCTHFS